MTQKGNITDFFKLKKKKKKKGGVGVTILCHSIIVQFNSIHFLGRMALDKLSGKMRHAVAFSLLRTSGIYFQ